MKSVVFSVSEDGYATAQKIQSFLLDCNHYTSVKKTEGISRPISPSLSTMTSELFDTVDALIYVMATGIAVRMIAPHIRSKDKDPAVIVIDDQCQWVIPILSGHIGGANALCLRLAHYLNAIPVITTATDNKNLMAVDLLAQNLNADIASLTQAKKATAALLKGQRLHVIFWNDITPSLPTEYAIADTATDIDGWYLRITPYSHSTAACEVWLIPQIITLGIGARKNITRLQVHKAIQSALSHLNIDIRAVKQLVSIDLKAHEEGIVSMAKKLKIPFNTYSADVLAEVEHLFDTSSFVKQTTGAGSVSDAAGFLATHGTCLLSKYIYNGVTISVWEESYEFR